MNIEDFFPSYKDPNYKYLQSDLAAREELKTLKLDAQETIPDIPGQPLLSQKILNRILSPYTLYGDIIGMLIVHKMGTGKTCLAVGVAQTCLAFMKRISNVFKYSAGIAKDLQNIIPKKRVLVIVKSDNLRISFVNQLTEKCTDGEYIPKLEDEEEEKGISEIAYRRRTKKLYSENYEIVTFEQFSREIQNKITDPKFIEEYSNRLIIIDEAHNLRPTEKNFKLYSKLDDCYQKFGLNITEMLKVVKSKTDVLESYLRGGIMYPIYRDYINYKSTADGKMQISEFLDNALKNLEVPTKYYDIMLETLTTALDTLKEPSDELNMYGRIHTFLHTIKSPRVLLLTGTPMVDNAKQEMINIMNLILPSDMQLSQKASDEDIGNSMFGRVSYLREMITTVERYDMGTAVKGADSTEHLKLVEVKMSDFQYKAYKEANALDMETSKDEPIEPITDARDTGKQGKGDFKINSRQALNFVFPDGSWGVKGVKKYCKKSGDTKTSQSIDIGEELSKDIKRNGLAHYSAKFDYIITMIRKNPKQCCFIFDHHVSGAGVEFIGALLKLWGYSRANGTETTKKPRFAVLSSSSQASRISQIIRKFNSSENKTGEIIQVIIGSAAISEGITFNHITKVFIASPYWNNNRIEQAIYRSIRIGVHRDIIKYHEEQNLDPPKVEIFRMSSTAPNGGTTVDRQLYAMSERKDVEIMKYERLLKIASIDCELTYNRNRLKTDIDGSRACNYEDCDYVCKGVAPKSISTIYNTYILYYSIDLQNDITELILTNLRESGRVYVSSLYRLRDIASYKTLPENVFDKILNLAIIRLFITHRYVDVDGIEYVTTIKDDVIYLCPIIKPFKLARDDSSVFYCQYPPIQYGYSLSDIIEFQQSKNDSAIIDKICKNKGDAIENYISKLSLNARTHLYEIAMGIKIDGPKGNKLVDSIINYGQNIEKVIEMSHKTLTINERMRKYENGEFMDVLSPSEETVSDKQGGKKGKKSDKKGSKKGKKGDVDYKIAKRDITLPDRFYSEPIYGKIINGKLFIVDHESERVEKTDQRSSVGRNCTSIIKIQLINLLYKLGVKAPIEGVEGKTAEDVINGIENIDAKSFKNVFKRDASGHLIDKYDIKYLKYVSAWVSRKDTSEKSGLCDILMKELKKKNLIIYIDSDGNVSESSPLVS